MSSQDIETLKYPIGHFENPDPVTAVHISQWIKDIEELPGLIREIVGSLDEDKLNLPYRPGGWTIRQVVHHLADSHFNSFVRFKLALTEDNPVIKPYNQAGWAQLPDGKEAPVENSLLILEGLHKRWATLLKSMSTEQFGRTFVHPERKTVQKLILNLGLYAWHGKHHLAHIRQALEL